MGLFSFQQLAETPSPRSLGDLVSSSGFLPGFLESREVICVRPGTGMRRRECSKETCEMWSWGLVPAWGPTAKNLWGAV